MEGGMRIKTISIQRNYGETAKINNCFKMFDLKSSQIDRRERFEVI
jgi:hypothetical protein